MSASSTKAAVLLVGSLPFKPEECREILALHAQDVAEV